MPRLVDFASGQVSVTGHIAGGRRYSPSHTCGAGIGGIRRIYWLVLPPVTNAALISRVIVRAIAIASVVSSLVVSRRSVIVSRESLRAGKVPCGRSLSRLKQDKKRDCYNEAAQKDAGDERRGLIGHCPIPYSFLNIRRLENCFQFRTKISQAA